MYLIDWLIVAVPLIVVLIVTVYANRYLKDIADFMAGGRLAGRDDDVGPGGHEAAGDHPADAA